MKTGYSCSASRRTVRVRRNGRSYTQYYVADSSRPQNLWVRARVGNCALSRMRGCRFEGSATYKFSS